MCDIINQTWFLPIGFYKDACIMTCMFTINVKKPKEMVIDFRRITGVHDNKI